MTMRYESANKKKEKKENKTGVAKENIVSLTLENVVLALKQVLALKLAHGDLCLNSNLLIYFFIFAFFSVTVDF